MPIDTFDNCVLHPFELFQPAVNTPLGPLRSYLKSIQLRVRIAHPDQSSHFYPVELPATVDTGATFSIMPTRIVDWFNKTTRLPETEPPRPRELPPKLPHATQTKLLAINGERLQPYPQPAFHVNLHLIAKSIAFNNFTSNETQTQTAIANSEYNDPDLGALIFAAVDSDVNEVTLGMNVLSRWKLVLNPRSRAGPDLRIEIPSR